MKKLAAFSCLSPFLRLAPLLVLLVIFSTSCQFPGFGEKPPCEESVLQIAERSYQIKEIKTKSDGSLNVPSNSPDTAYWVDQTNINYVFALSPTEDNLALQDSLKEGDQATITWENCNTVTFNLPPPQASTPDNATLFSQDVSGITIFIQPSSANNGFVIKGELAEEIISEFNTPDTSQPQAEISLLETTASEDGQTITIEISILNYGQAPFTVTPDDISLTPENADPLTPTNTDPALPYEIKPSETVNIQLTFPRPDSQTAILKILGIEYDVEGY